ncbi:hypothetical protein JCM14076_29550 [Methylosoma difficile]
MAFLYSNSFSDLDLSPSDIFEISQEISRDFQALPAADANALSQQDLLAISNTISRDYAPSLQSEMADSSTLHYLAPAEILSISTDITHSFTPQVADDSHHLVLLPLDPNNLYAYWQVGSEHFGFTPPEEENLKLRLSNNIKASPLEIPVSHQGQQTISIHPQAGVTQYQLALGYENTGHFAPLLESQALQTIMMPTAAQAKPHQSLFRQPDNIFKTQPVYSGKSASGQNLHKHS